MALITQMTFSGGGIGPDNLLSGIPASKVIHQIPINQELFEASTTVAALTKMLFIAGASGTLKAFEGITITPATGADRTVSVDLQKSTGGGAFATVLSTNIEMDDNTVARTVVSSVFNSTSFVDGDIFQAVVTVAGSAGNQAIGLLVTLLLNVNPVS